MLTCMSTCSCARSSTVSPLGSCLYEGQLRNFSMGGNCRLGLLDVNETFNLTVASYPKSVRSGTTWPPLAMPASTMVGSRCPRCGTINKSGKRSCCARGGAWFRNCGDAGNTKFDHTWVEGIQACKSTLLGD